MLAFSRVFVALVFAILGVSFLVSTYAIVSEFRDSELVAILTSSSYLFVFFPTLGIVALVAFYIPAVVFTDLYLRHVPFGRLRFLLGTIFAVGLAVYFAESLQDTRLRSTWEISPQALNEDARRGPQCLEERSMCVKPVLPVIADLRSRSLERIRISPFIRDCMPDELMEENPEQAKVRYCFPAGERLDAERCCRVKQAYAERVYALYADPTMRSQAAGLERLLLPFKAFFIIVIVLIGFLLITWKRMLKRHYAHRLVAMERGLQVGAAAMLLWPIMDYAYQQTSDVLYGPQGQFPYRLSLVVVPWALLITAYFADRIRIELARLVQIVGGIVSAVAVLRYQDISDWSSKLVGLGASEINLVLLALLAIVMIVILLRWLFGTLRGEEAMAADHDDRSSNVPPPLT